VLFLYALKLNYPSKVFLLRGNHETKVVASHFTFRAEVLYKYDEEVFNAIMDSFHMMPIAAEIDGKYFAVHGGLSPMLGSVSKIQEINRKVEIPNRGPLCDLMWSDPVANDMGKLANSQVDFLQNTKRNCSFNFGKRATQKFLKYNGYVCVIRAHEV